MKTKLLILFIYLSGCIIGYIMGKNYMISINKEHNNTPVYSTRDRMINLTVSALSWPNVVAIGIIYLGNEANTDKPASW